MCDTAKPAKLGGWLLKKKNSTVMLVVSVYHIVYNRAPYICPQPWRPVYNVNRLELKLRYLFLSVHSIATSQQLLVVGSKSCQS